MMIIYRELSHCINYDINKEISSKNTRYWYLCNKTHSINYKKWRCCRNDDAVRVPYNLPSRASTSSSTGAAAFAAAAGAAAPPAAAAGAAPVRIKLEIVF